MKLTLLLGIVVLAALSLGLSGWCIFTLRDLLLTTQHPGLGDYLVAGCLAGTVIGSAAGTAVRSNRSKN